MSRWSRVRAFAVLSTIVAVGWIAALAIFAVLQGFSREWSLAQIGRAWLRGLPFTVGTGAIMGLGFVVLLRALRPQQGFGALGLARVAVFGFAASLFSYMLIIKLFLARYFLTSLHTGLTIFVGGLGSAVAVGLVLTARRGKELPPGDPGVLLNR
ncbi:MAG TPA: hypothetical protein VGM20_07165 [Gemmatimonadales bacterium]|jgi:hypothetical protein